MIIITLLVPIASNLNRRMNIRRGSQLIRRLGYSPKANGVAMLFVSKEWQLFDKTDRMTFDTGSVEWDDVVIQLRTLGKNEQDVELLNASGFLVSIPIRKPGQAVLEGALAARHDDNQHPAFENQNLLLLLPETNLQFWKLLPYMWYRNYCYRRRFCVSGDIFSDASNNLVIAGRKLLNSNLAGRVIFLQRVNI